MHPKMANICTMALKNIYITHMMKLRAFSIAIIRDPYTKRLIASKSSSHTWSAVIESIASDSMGYTSLFLLLEEEDDAVSESSNSSSSDELSTENIAEEEEFTEREIDDDEEDEFSTEPDTTRVCSEKRDDTKEFAPITLLLRST